MKSRRGESAEPAFPLQGRRILVLSLQGDMSSCRSSRTHQSPRTYTFTSICCFDHKLLASYHNFTFDSFTFDSASEVSAKGYGMLALRGLTL